MKTFFVKKYQQFILMLTFLTRIPIKYSFDFEPETFGRGYVFFPVIGGIIGVLLSGLTLLKQVIPLSILSFLMIIWYLLIVGGIHIDGVADLFDGIFSARKKERMLEIMEDSHVGAFGAIGLILYFLGMYSGIMEVLGKNNGWLYLLFMPVISRTITVFTTGFCKYAKPSGLGKGMVDSIKPYIGSSLLVITIAFIFLINVECGIATVGTTLIMALIVYRIHGVLDGITGDVVGASVEIGQVVYLCILSIIVM